MCVSLCAHVSLCSSMLGRVVLTCEDHLYAGLPDFALNEVTCCLKATRNRSFTKRKLLEIENFFFS